MLYLLSQKRW